MKKKTPKAKDSSYRYNGTGLSRAEFLALVIKRDILRRVPKPKSDAEFAILSEWFFGRPLRVTMSYAGQYEIVEKFDSYQDYQFHCYDGERSIRGLSQYDTEKVIMNLSFGVLRCGGTAGSQYGQTAYGYRDKKRMQFWIDSRRSKHPSKVRKPFTRLAEQIRARREQTDSR